MVELIKSILTSDAGSFGTVVLVGCALFMMIWKVSHFNTKFSLVDKLENNIDSIKDDISIIKAFISVAKSEINIFTERNSPIGLNKYGVEASKSLDIKEMIHSNWDKINQKLEQQIKKEDNLYDIQQSCMKLSQKIRDYMSEDEFDKIKSHAFKEGRNISQYDLIFAIEIRDHYFKANDINILDIDRHDPTLKG